MRPAETISLSAHDRTARAAHLDGPRDDGARPADGLDRPGRGDRDRSRELRRARGPRASRLATGVTPRAHDALRAPHARELGAPEEGPRVEELAPRRREGAPPARVEVV